MVRFFPRFFLTLGETNKALIYIKNTSGDWVRFANYEYFKVVKKQNQVVSFEIKVYDLSSLNKLFVKEGTELLFFSDTTLIQKGRIQTITYSSNFDATIKGFGMEVKLLDKEFLEKSNTSAVWNSFKSSQYTNVSAQIIANELLSSNSNGSAPFIITPGTDGLFSSDYGLLSMRFENANRLKALAKLSDAIDYEWDVVQSEDITDNYNSDFFQIVELLPNNTRATNSQQTFQYGGANANCYVTHKETDITNIGNFISIIGRGDGINQLSVTTYNASDTYSTLSSDITDSSSTISLVDASSFPSSGEIRIMSERITYSGKSSNDLTGCIRGTSSTTALEHKKHVFVEKYIDVDSAEVGSSIEENGLVEFTDADTSLIDIPTMELIASKKLLENKDPIVYIRIRPIEPLEFTKNRKIGDLITVNDSESDISQTTRIVGIIYTSDYGILDIEVECSNKTLNFIEQMRKDKESAENLSKYMQGATNLYSIQSYENADNSNPLFIRFYLPEDVIAINDVNLRFSTQKFRGYSSTAESGGGSTPTTSDGGGTTPTSSVNSASSGVASSASANASVAINSNVWTSLSSITTANTDCEGVFLNANMTFASVSGSTDNSGGLFHARIYDGSSYFPDVNGQDFCGGVIWNDEFMLNGNISRYIPGNNKNKTYTLQVKWTGWSNSFNWTVNSDINYATFTRHNHTVTIPNHNHTVTISNHTHPIGHTISEDTFPSGSPQVKVEVDNGLESSWTEVGGSPFSATDGGFYSTDLTSLVSDIGTSNWVTVRLTPQNGASHNNLRLEANINTKVFIEST